MSQVSFRKLLWECAGLIVSSCFFAHPVDTCSQQTRNAGSAECHLCLDGLGSEHYRQRHQQGAGRSLFEKPGLLQLNCPWLDQGWQHARPGGRNASAYPCFTGSRTGEQQTLFGSLSAPLLPVILVRAVTLFLHSFRPKLHYTQPQKHLRWRCTPGVLE